MLPWFENGKFPLYLAPMAGFTDVVFRQLCKNFGADVMITEFVMSEAVLRGKERAWEEIDFTETQRPMGVQIFGSDPKSMSHAALRIVERLNPDFIDINYGCPSPRVTCGYAGSSLLRDLVRLKAIGETVVKTVAPVPVTAKIRTGWDAQSIVADEAGLHLQDAGIQALTIHGRTREQGYSGEANWDIIYQAAETLTIPVIGNGSIKTAQDVYRIQSESQVAGIMIGRAALGNPWIFQQIKNTLKSGHPAAIEVPTSEERWDLLLDYCRQLLDRPYHQARDKQIGWLKTRLKSFIRDFPGSRTIRNELNSITSIEELEDLYDRYRLKN